MSKAMTSMVCWENKDLIGIDRFTVLDSSRNKVYFLQMGVGGFWLIRGLWKRLIKR